MLCCCDYAETVVAIFAHQIKSEYYGGNRYFSIESILLERFSAPTQTETSVASQACIRHYVLHSFLSEDIKQYASTTIEHSKRIIELLKQRNIMPNNLSTILENTDCCAKHYRCDTTIYLVSMLSQEFSVIIDHGILSLSFL